MNAIQKTITVAFVAVAIFLVISGTLLYLARDYINGGMKPNRYEYIPQSLKKGTVL